jgi:hypothetical protein
MHGVPALRTYEISVSGNIGTLADVFQPHVVRVEGGRSIIRVEQVDQATLFGLIGRVQELGLDLREVRIAG